MTRRQTRRSCNRAGDYAVFLLLCPFLFSLSAQAQQDDAAELIAIIDAVEHGWEEGDARPFRMHFLDFDGARYIESGGQNSSLTELIEHHVIPESGALDGFDITFSNIDTHFEGDFAWAVADFEYKATVKSDGSKKHGRGYQTFLFRRIDAAWMVVHTHSSTRPVKDDDHEH